MSNIINKIQKKEGYDKKRKVISCLPKYPENGIILYLDEEHIERIFNKVIAVKKYKLNTLGIYEKINDFSYFKNLGYMALELAKIIELPFSVSEFFCKAKDICHDSTDLYPGMPIKLIGNIEGFINETTLRITYNEVTLDTHIKEQHTLLINQKFIYGRLIFLIGEVFIENHCYKINTIAILC